MARRVGTSAAETRARILSEARDHLVEAGAVRFSTRTVARAAGVSVSVVYHYFTDRDALIDACIDTAYDEVHAATVSMRERVGSSLADRDIFATAVREGFRFARDHRELVRALNLIVLRDGRLDAARRRVTEAPLLAAAAEVVALRCGVQPAEARLRLRTLIHLVARYAVADVAELRDLTGAQDDSTALGVVEDHVAAVAGLLLDGTVVSARLRSGA